MPAAFTLRALLGWISEFVNRTLPGVWPQIALDDATLADFDAYFDLCRASNYNEVVIGASLLTGAGPWTLPRVWTMIVALESNASYRLGT